MRECLRWEDGDGATNYQDEILGHIVVEKKVSVRGPHGLGKSTFVAWVVLWFALTRDGKDWKCLTTAGSWRQLTKYLWPEIHKWARRLRWDVIGRTAFTVHELLDLSIKLKTGEAFAVASDKADLIEGAHADHVLYVYDESKSISSATFDASEGAFSGAGKDTGREAYALAVSTPGEPNGRFHAIHARKRGYQDWWVRHVKVGEVIAAGRISQEWVEAKKLQWGEESPIFKRRVLGEFSGDDVEGVIPLSWIEAANERWYLWAEEHKPGTFTRLAIDVAGGGGNKTVMGRRFDSDEIKALDTLETFNYADTMQTADKAISMLANNKNVICVVDATGLGAGTAHRIRQKHSKTVTYKAGGKTKQKDRTNTYEFFDIRSCDWWSLREQLDPINGDNIALPPDDNLTADLTTPHYHYVSGDKIKVESKDDFRTRLKESRDGEEDSDSTDWGDTTVMAFANVKLESISVYRGMV